VSAKPDRRRSRPPCARHSAASPPVRRRGPVISPSGSPGRPRRSCSRCDMRSVYVACDRRRVTGCFEAHLGAATRDHVVSAGPSCRGGSHDGGCARRCACCSARPADSGSAGSGGPPARSRSISASSARTASASSGLIIMEALLVTSVGTWSTPMASTTPARLSAGQGLSGGAPVPAPVRRGRSVEPGRIAYMRVEFDVDQADVGRHPRTDRTSRTRPVARSRASSLGFA
jgi:hypothetical protein